ncbi:MAG: hypothetical protein RJA57_1754 [Bacteroidota bacterium]|jgi:uncharacterized lipoprotein YddW (UPF0748 family)
MIRFCILCISLCSLWPAEAQPSRTIRGTWITNVGSDALRTKKQVRRTVALCKRNGLTDLFVVVWNNGVTLYPSDVVRSHIGIAQDTVYAGFDPIDHIVRVAHRAGLKVHAWFEFGFSYSYKDSNSRWLERHPDWVGRDNQGHLLRKNGFYWWNALHPEVQAFMEQLVLEVVQRYAVDGIQGDDRLPAMPAEGGYDAFTRQLYASEQGGASVPADPRAAPFLQWKADKLSAFGKRLYLAVKSRRSDCLVSWAPSIYPWSKEQYLQDWPAWLNGGYADLIIPQLYRYKADAYEKIVRELASQVTPPQRSKLVPGILTSLGDGYQASRPLMDTMVRLNRELGFDGEVFFYFETLRRIKGTFYNEKK